MRSGYQYCVIISLCILLVAPQVLVAQTKRSSDMFFSLNYRLGQNRPHHEVISHLDYFYHGMDAKLGWQTLGKTRWQQAYRFPSLGIGANWNTFNNQVLGSPGALYFFVSFPQFRYGLFRLDLETNLGISYGLTPYDPVTNPENFAVGSSVNTYFGLFLEPSLRIAPKVDLFLSGGFSHYSNATMNYPNLGLNVFMCKAGIRYLPSRTPYENREKISAPRDWLLGFTLFAGMKKLTTPTPTYYQLGFAAMVNKRLSYKNMVFLGYEAAYNQATQAMYWDRTLPFRELVSHAVFAGHEFQIDRFSIGTLFGIYLKHRPTDKFYYERIYAAYEISPGVRATLGLKAHFIKAEYLEVGLAYRFKTFRKKSA